MKENRNASAPKSGMKLDLHINQLKETDYSFALNSNTEQETGELLNQFNEPSDNLTVVFPEGYKVIGRKKYLQGNKTFYFLTNPETKKSSIGYVDDTFIENRNIDEYVPCTDCSGKNELGTPLEEIDQVPSKQYEQLINDECLEVGEGLDFDIDFPIKFIAIKVEKGQVNLYWNDYRNLPRWMNTTDVSYLYIQEIPCDDDVAQDCLIVDKLLQFPKYGSFGIDPEKLEIGGNLKLGSYEFYGAYCDLYGNNLSEYFPPTNPISIFDENNNILSQTELDSYTNFAIKLKVQGLDNRYPYYKIVCVERNNVNNTQAAFLEGIHPTTDDTVLYTSSGTSDDDGHITSGNKRLRKRMDISELYYTKTKYDKAVGSASINGAQYMWGLYKKPELNLQPVVNLFGSLLKWQTSIAKEDLYKHAIATSKYKGYMRDEVQPFALRFWFKDGGYTSNFPFIGRPAVSGERDLISTDNHNRASIEDNAPDCTSTERQEKWQFFNTASVIGVCEISENIETQEVQETLNRSCNIEAVATIEASTTSVAINGNYINLETYIDENYDEVTNPSSEYYIPEIAPYLTDEYTDDHCEAYFEGDCETPSLLDFEVSISTVENEQTTLIEQCISEYTKTVPALQCNPFKIDNTTGESEPDEDFANDYMACATEYGGDPEDLPTVFKRNFIYYNEDCGYATIVPDNSPPEQQGIAYFHRYYGADTLPELLTTKDVVYTDSDFKNKLHVGAMFFKINKNGRDKMIFEVTKNSECDDTDDIPIGSTLRYNFYGSCTSDTPLDISIVEPDNPDCTYSAPTEGVFDTTEGLLIEIDVSSYPETFYVAIDAPIKAENVPASRASLPTGCGATTVKYRTAPTCGCFGVNTRDVEYAYADISWDSITIDKRETYQATCTFEIPLVGDCEPVPYAYGEFGFWESTEEYPDNTSLFDSSGLFIRTQDLDTLSAYDKNRFEEYYTGGVANDIYILNEETNLTCRKIRHPKMPDNTVAPFMSDIAVAPFSDTFIYPLGVVLDDKVVVTMLNIALTNGLISQKDYDNIEGFEILRGDNSVSKSVLANGLGYDMYKYSKGNNTYLYPNFPHNDLGEDLLHYEDSSRTNLIQHPFSANKNNRFSFLSPDIFLTKPPIPTEVVLSGYQLGNTSGRFVDVEEHPKWTILGDRGRSTADTLAFAESAIEYAIQSAEFVTQGGLGHFFFMAGLSSGTNAVGMVASIIATAIALTAMTINNFVRYGQYRYQWLQTFRDLGTAYNFAGYNVSVGYHNKFIRNNYIYDEGNAEGLNEYVRGLSIKKYMKDGRYVFRDNTTVSEDKLFVNNWSREHSVFLSTGDYYFRYMDNYKNHDNNKLSPEQGSRTVLSQNGCTVDVDYERNVGSPYFTLRNYVPDQYGTLDSIKWLTTNGKFNLGETTTCKPIFGGTVSISRFSWKRKIALFTTDAMGLPDKLAFNYGEYNNIAETKYYCDYEADSTKNILGVPFPEIDSNFTFDCLNGKTGFYVKPHSKMYLYYYGIADFLVESEINCNYRYGRKELKDNFYPSVGDVVGWTQQKNVPISEPNTFFYNNTYSLPVSNTPYKYLGSTYSSIRQEIVAKQDNAVIVSQTDNDENSPVDPWLIFKPLDWFEFSAEYGKLIELKGIENGQILARFEDRQLILNAVDNLADRMLPQTKELGTGGVFNTRPKESNVSDLGFMGTQHHQMLSTPFGHITVDAKRGKIHLTSSQGTETISESVGGHPTFTKNWFREQLPFKILQYFPEFDIDNNYKGVGISMGWDARHDRAFITKLDYVPKKELSYCNGRLVNTNLEDYQETIQEYVSNGYTFHGIEECQLKFTKYQLNITPNTDIYVYFDTTSMTTEDAQAALVGITDWFSEYQANNPTYSGNIYTIPTVQERYLLNIYNINLSTTQFPNTNTTTDWAPFYNLPPNANTTSFVAPSDLLIINFIDEVEPPYHSTTENSFGSQPITGLNNFVSNYMSFRSNVGNFNNFRCVMYPVVRNSGFQSGATKNLILHLLAAIEGTTLTQEQIDETGTVADVSSILTNNPYEGYVLPDTTEYIPLKDFGFIGFYNKVSPATEVFGSEDFKNDLNSFTNIGTQFIEDDEVYIPLDEISINDSEYFEDVSWTIAFKPSEGWISYYSFTPNYYSYHNDYFQSGYNYDNAELWSHTLNNSSVQVFRGVKYPWIVEVPLKTQNVNKMLKSLEINIEAKRYQNEWDYSQHNGIGFNKMVVYNNTNNSGLLNLVEQKRPSDSNKYPITNSNNSQDILYTSENGKHYVNYFFNRVKNQYSNIPNWLWDSSRINKTVNPQAVGFYGKKLLERMKGQQFVIRLIQDRESRFSMTLKDVITRETISE